MAKVEYCTAEQRSQNPDSLESKGMLLIGVGSGRLGEQEEAKMSILERVVKVLEITVGLDLDRILRLLNDDGSRTYSLPLIPLTEFVKMFHRQYPENPEKAVEWVMPILDLRYQEESVCLAATKKAFDGAKLDVLFLANAKTLQMATILSDNEQVERFARTHANIGIVLQRKANGFTLVSANQRLLRDLRNIIRMIRVEERRVRSTYKPTDWQELQREGSDGVWAYEPKYFRIANRNDPTKLSLEKIQELIRIGVNYRAFEPSRASFCLRGICTSKPGSVCDFRKWELTQCLDILETTREKQQERAVVPKLKATAGAAFAPSLAKTAEAEVVSDSNGNASKAEEKEVTAPSA